MFNFVNDIMRNAIVANKDAQGATVQTAEDCIAEIRKECESKLGDVQFIMTEPKPHPAQPNCIVTVLDAGSAVVIDKADTRAAVYQRVLAVIGKMKTKLRDTEKELQTMLDNPLIPGVQAINEEIDKKLGE